jgi:hypothetical protein
VFSGGVEWVTLIVSVSPIPLGGCTTLISTIFTPLGCAVQLEALAVGSVQ